MDSRILNPCPMCGKRFDFPLTGCMTFVDQLLKASDGKCPDCGTQVVLDDQPEPSAWELADDFRDFPLAELDLSVRTRVAIDKMQIHFVGELLKLSKAQITASGGNYAVRAIDELNELLQIKGVTIA